MNEDNNLVSGDESKEKIVTLTSEEDNMDEEKVEKVIINKEISNNINNENIQTNLSRQSENIIYVNNEDNVIKHNIEKPNKVRSVIILILIALVLIVVGVFSYVYFIMLNPLKVINTSLNIGKNEIKTSFKGILPNLPENINTIKTNNKININNESNIDLKYDYDIKNNKSKSIITIPTSLNMNQVVELYKINDKNYIKSQLLGKNYIEMVESNTAKYENNNKSNINFSQIDTSIISKIIDKYLDVISNNLNKNKIKKIFSNTTLNNKETLTYILTYTINNEEFKKLNTKAVEEILKDENMFIFIKTILGIPNMEKDKELQIINDYISNIKLDKNIELKFYISVFDKNNSRIEVKYNNLIFSIYKDNDITTININNLKIGTNIKIMPNIKTKQLIIVIKNNDSEYKITYQLTNEDKTTLSFKIDIQITSTQYDNLKLTTKSDIVFNENLKIDDIKASIKSNTLKPEENKVLDELLNKIKMFNFGI